ncbi:hypothetical protein KP509_01G072400 [Ceratopteris richardii]|uniref:Blue (type 1) copper domain-containing protein n=1 Tax=Ceratopteris richardii TaxID=49495 RepID=A0A8T2VE70_CERRI|nr:hypothetical protein KP509_01G072400 [Ceratopteris richardii]
MASRTAASVEVPSFCGLKAVTSSSRSSTPIALVAPVQHPSLSISASLHENVMKASSKVLIATTAAALLDAGPSLAAKIEVGDEIGNFKFSTVTVTVVAGEPIEFTLVGETGHNVVFDVPAGAPATVASELQANSMDENDILSKDEPTFTTKVSNPGTYTYYCKRQK